MAFFSQSSSQWSRGDPGVVFVHLAVAFAPVVELAGRDSQPADEAAGRELCLLRPAVDEIDDLVADVVGSPLAVQVWPRLFLARRVRP